MNKIPLTIALFTSTKGHFDVKSRYLETVKNLNEKIPLSQFENLIAHIKYSDEDSELEEMSQNLEKFGFEVLYTPGQWSHKNDGSHQEEYLKDINTIFSYEKTLSSKYTLFLEDDWLFNPYEMDLLYWISEAMKILEENPECNQVRFPRFHNEFDRINKLKSKHGIDATAIKGDEKYFICNDFSLNPSIFRSRDIFSAINLVMKNPNVFPRHVEHGLGAAIKYLYDLFPLSFAVFEPSKIKVRHIGCPIGQEDTEKPLESN